MIVVISDSHVPNRAKEIPKPVLDKVQEADKVVHCGDFATKEVFKELKDFNENLVAVKGNCDFFELPNSEAFENEGVKLGIYHGTGITPRGDHETLLDIAENKLKVDILLHGHTHQEEIHEEDGTVLLNPGSCTGVGGGSARSSNPTIIELGFDKTVNIKLYEEQDDELKVRETRRFPIKESK